MDRHIGCLMEWYESMNEKGSMKFRVSPDYSIYYLREQNEFFQLIYKELKTKDRAIEKAIEWKK